MTVGGILHNKEIVTAEQSFAAWHTAVIVVEKYDLDILEQGLAGSKHPGMLQSEATNYDDKSEYTGPSILPQHHVRKHSNVLTI